MSFLNKKQLAFILDITDEEARAKMCVAWAKSLGVTNSARREEKVNKKGKPTGKKKLVDTYPDTMLVEMLATQLNLPFLPQAVEDIKTGYLKRPAARKWILCDFPEKSLKTKENAGDKLTLSIPVGLKSMLPTAIADEIKKEWTERFPMATVK